MTRRKGGDAESRAREEHHRSIDRLEAAINEPKSDYDRGQAGRVAAASRREKRARAAHEQASGRTEPGGRQDEAQGAH